MAFVNRCIFTPVSAGTGDFTVSAAVPGYHTPAQANAVDGATYSYAAQSSDLTQWEDGQGVYTAGSTTLARTTILDSSTGGKVSFTAAPQVMLTALAQDLFQEISTAPLTNTSAGTPLQFAFDASGNLYMCWATNTWAQYTNVAPFNNGGSGNGVYYYYLGF